MWRPTQESSIVVFLPSGRRFFQLANDTHTLAGWYVPDESIDFMPCFTSLSQMFRLYFSENIFWPNDMAPGENISWRKKVGIINVQATISRLKGNLSYMCFYTFCKHLSTIGNKIKTSVSDSLPIFWRNDWTISGANSYFPAIKLRPIIIL